MVTAATLSPPTPFITWRGINEMRLPSRSLNRWTTVSSTMTTMIVIIIIIIIIIIAAAIIRINEHQNRRHHPILRNFRLFHLPNREECCRQGFRFHQLMRAKSSMRRHHWQQHQRHRMRVGIMQLPRDHWRSKNKSMGTRSTILTNFVCCRHHLGSNPHLHPLLCEEPDQTTNLVTRRRSKAIRCGAAIRMHQSTDTSLRRRRRRHRHQPRMLHGARLQRSQDRRPMLFHSRLSQMQSASWQNLLPKNSKLLFSKTSTATRSMPPPRLM
mmetsp:Transcript_17368/g.48962  ORF Transcript_17368/g.48962 Transcript_17368/m.48962 type:complete len:269 (-) Transcript_17368:423-1229(-)